MHKSHKICLAFIKFPLVEAAASDTNLSGSIPIKSSANKSAKYSSPTKEK